MATVQFDPIGKFLYTKDDMGNYHSYDDKPAIEYLDGSELKIWYKNGLIHREFDTNNSYFSEYKYAIIYRNMNNNYYKKWYINGEEIKV